MASYDTWYNLLTGLSQGAFDRLELRDSNGAMQNILALLGNSGSGGISDVQVTAPLIVVSSGTVRIVSVDLASYSTSAQMQALLNQKQNILQAGTGITLSGNTVSFDGTLYFTAAQIAVLFTAYTSTIGLKTRSWRAIQT